VFQQQSAPAIQRYTSAAAIPMSMKRTRASAAVVRGETFMSSSAPSPRTQRWGLSDIRDYIADKANIIPGFRMFTIVIGVNLSYGNGVDVAQPMCCAPYRVHSFWRPDHTGAG